MSPDQVANAGSIRRVPRPRISSKYVKADEFRAPGHAEAPPTAGPWTLNLSNGG